MLFGRHEAPRPGVPRLRGVSHKYAFFVSVPAALGLVLRAGAGEATLAALVYAFGLSGLLGTSALYHRGPWRPRVRRWMRRLDHSMIFVLIAASYTPFALVSMQSEIARLVLGIMWLAALGGVMLKVLWIDAPDWLSAVVYVAVAWTMILTFGELTGAIGLFASTLVVLGGLCYTVGAILYALKRPVLSPQVFGYHELFHLLVIAGAAFHFAVIAVYVL